MRIGCGFDVHAFSNNRPLIIGGVNIPYYKGLLAHSDGDVALHSVIDSLLGAAALGDIGKLFPDIDPSYKLIESRILLRRAWKKIKIRGYYLGNLDLTLIIQDPIIAPYISKMRTNISEDLNCHINNINIKATTTEKLSFIGRKEGIACMSVSLLFKHYKE